MNRPWIYGEEADTSELYQTPEATLKALHRANIETRAELDEQALARIDRAMGPLKLNMLRRMLDRAGERQDRADAAFAAVTCPFKALDEDSFGAAEREAMEARAEYRRILSLITDQTPEDLQRRIAA